MTNPTSNFGWQMPTSTDLVTDLPADFEVFGQAVDTSLADLKGGTTGQFLAKATNTNMDFVWTTPSTGPTGYTLLNAGGTALSGTTTTVSFSAQKKLWIYFNAASANSGGSDVSVRFNGDSASNYQYLASAIIGGSSWATTNVTYEDGSTGASSARLFYFSNNQNSTALGSISMDLTDQTGWKTFDFFGAPEPGSGTGQWQFNGKGLYKATAAITSVSLVNSTGNFDAGRVYVYGAN